MELKQLNALVKVVQAGSFTQAALALNSQKAHLSRQISELERQLGVRLIERSTRSLSLTEVGREVYERAVGILGAVEDTERVAHQLLADPRGTLKLTCGVEFGIIAVSRWVSRYLQRYPQVKVEADYTTRTVDLVHEGYDLAIRIGPVQESRLVARPLGELRYGLFASPDYLARHGEPQTPQDLTGHELLVFHVGSHRQGWLLRDARRQTFRVQGQARLRVNNSFGVRDATRLGQGIAQLPWVLAQADVEAGALRPLLPAWQPDTVPVQALFPSSRYLTPKVRCFIDHAVQCFSTELPDLVAAEPFQVGGETAADKANPNTP